MRRAGIGARGASGASPPPARDARREIRASASGRRRLSMQVLVSPRLASRWTRADPDLPILNTRVSWTSYTLTGSFVSHEAIPLVKQHRRKSTCQACYAISKHPLGPSPSSVFTFTRTVRKIAWSLVLSNPETYEIAYIKLQI